MAMKSYGERKKQKKERGEKEERTLVKLVLTSSFNLLEISAIG